MLHILLTRGFLQAPSDQYELSFIDFDFEKQLFQCMQNIFLTSSFFFLNLDIASSITFLINLNSSILVINFTKGLPGFCQV